VVSSISKAWLGVVGGVLAILGVVAAPITTGDTALRSCRLIIAELFKLDQKPLKNRILLAIPIFAVSIAVVWYNIADEEGFNKIWRYFGWINQTLSCITLWTIMIWLARHRTGMYYLFAMVPAFFMTATCITFICVTETGFGLPAEWTPWIAALSVVLSAAVSFPLINKHKKVYPIKDCDI